MRRTYQLMPALLAAFALGACSSSSNPAESDSRSTTDGGGADTGRASGMALVRVFNGSGPLANASVAIHGADGSLKEVLTTNAKGELEADIETGGAVTALMSEQTNHQLVSVLGIEAGATVTIGDSRATAEPTVALVISAPKLVENAIGYYIDAGCAQAKVETLTIPYTMQIPAWCAASGKASVMMTSIGGDELPHSYAYAQEVPLTSGASTSITLSDWTVNWDSAFLKVLNPPAGSRTLRATLAPAIRELTFDAYSVATNMSAYPGATALSFHGIPQVFGLATSIDLGIGFGKDDTIYGESAIRYRDLDQNLADGTYTIEFDAQKLLLPAVTEPSVTPAAGGSPTVNWKTTGLDAQDGVAISLFYAKTRAWHVLAPPAEAGPLVLPTLPADWQDAAFDAAPAQTIVSVIDASDISSYSQLVAGRGTVILSQTIAADDAVVRFSSAIEPPLVWTPQTP